MHATILSRDVQYFFLPLSNISPCVMNDCAVMLPPALGMALLCSSRAGSDMWLRLCQFQSSVSYLSLNKSIWFRNVQFITMFSLRWSICKWWSLSNLQYLLDSKLIVLVVLVVLVEQDCWAKDEYCTQSNLKSLQKLCGCITIHLFNSKTKISFVSWTIKFVHSNVSSHCSMVWQGHLCTEIRVIYKACKLN